MKFFKNGTISTILILPWHCSVNMNLCFLFQPCVFGGVCVLKNIWINYSVLKQMCLLTAWLYTSVKLIYLEVILWWVFGWLAGSFRNYRFETWHACSLVNVNKHDIFFMHANARSAALRSVIAKSYDANYINFSRTINSKTGVQVYQ